MSAEYRLPFTASEIDKKLNKIDTLEEKIMNFSGAKIDLDATLSVEGAAADAKAVGDALANISGCDNTAACVIDLDQYSISADGTNATATTNGINQAIADAATAGYGTIVFPKGEYLIAGSDKINITGRLTVDFNNSILRKEANGYESYVMVEISGDHNVVKNATLYGDRETHDYTSEGTHEWGIGIRISGDSRFTTIENVDVFDTTGYGMNTSMAYNQIEPIRNRPLEAGCYDTSTGELVESTTHTVLGYTLDINDKAIRNNMFILGGNGYCAHGINEPMSFYMTYYDENEVYLGHSLVHRLYDNIDLESLLFWYPTLRYIKFSIENSDTETNVTLELRSSYTSDDITIKNCEIARCRTLGIAITGGRRILIENVSIHDIGGAAPGYGVDIEDGYQLNQYIVFRSCEFYNNKFGDIIVVKARDVLVENCRFQGFNRPEGGTAQPQGISAYGTITSKFTVRDSVFTGTSAGGDKFYMYNCIFVDCPGMEGNFTECRMHGGSIFNQHGTTLNRCHLNGTSLRYRNGNFSCYDSVLDNISQWDETVGTGNPSEFWIMDGCMMKNCGLSPKTGVPYIRITNNTVYTDSDYGHNCLSVNTKQKTCCYIVGNTLNQAGRNSVLSITDTYGGEFYLEGNVFTSTAEASIYPYNPRTKIACTGQVTISNNVFNTVYSQNHNAILHLENCAKTFITNNKMTGAYALPIKMVNVADAVCDGNEYTGTPVLAENCKGVDISDVCGKNYVSDAIANLSGGNIDLTGVVKSVNGHAPDENGNVEITVSNGGNTIQKEEVITISVGTDAVMLDETAPEQIVNLSWAVDEVRTVPAFTNYYIANSGISYPRKFDTSGYTQFWSTSFHGNSDAFVSGHTYFHAMQYSMDGDSTATFTNTDQVITSTGSNIISGSGWAYGIKSPSHTGQIVFCLGKTSTGTGTINYVYCIDITALQEAGVIAEGITLNELVELFGKLQLVPGQNYEGGSVGTGTATLSINRGGETSTVGNTSNTTTVKGGDVLSVEGGSITFLLKVMREVSVGPVKVWAGKKWVAFGDSLTDESINATKKYYRYIEEMTGITVVVMGKGGTGYYRTYDNGTAYGQRMAHVPADADVITIFGSVNDWHTKSANVAMGNASDTKEAGTLAGYINECIDVAIEKAPYAQIALVTPMDYHGLPDETLEQIANTIKAVANYRKIKCLDMYHESGFRVDNPVFAQQFTTDYSETADSYGHPSNLAHEKLIAPEFMELLKRMILTV